MLLYAAGMEITEDFFCISSHFVLCYLEQSQFNRAVPIYLVALVSTKAVLDVMITDQADQESFLCRGYKGLLGEFEGRRTQYELDLKYRQLRSSISAFLERPVPFHRVLQTAYSNLIKVTKKVCEQTVSDNGSRMDYLRSILHMHLNRLFMDQQRKQEMLVYFLLNKWLVSQRAIKSRKVSGRF